ncbi:hypothetical protein [Yoonia vestfoldensis]|uniref:hypothetical protein n=1 Tax=Yoonia vestfoldensis TaxID=245188 RepID=UPI00139036A0|nr:hypothetical protein [Yoonia vestfoldensis]
MKSQKMLDHSIARWQNDCTVMTDKTSKGQLKNPNRQKQVSYRLRHHFKNDPARERADIPPGGTRSRTFPAMGRGRRIVQWQQHNPPFSHPDAMSGRQGEAEGVGTEFHGRTHPKGGQQGAHVDPG